MRITRIILTLLACLLLAAHFLRAAQHVLVALALALPLLLCVRAVWSRRTLQVALTLAALEWLRTLALLAHGRITTDRPWFRLVAILGTVALVTLLAAWLPAGRPAPRSDSSS